MDCYDEEEAFTGVLIILGENIAFPLTAQLAGATVEVLDLDESASNLRRGIMARIRRDGQEVRVGLAGLTFEDLDETSAAWLAMYRWWAAMG